MRISPNFSSHELTLSADHPELVTPFEAIPLPAAVSLVRGVYVILQPVRDVVGPLIPISGYRSLELEAAVGAKSKLKRHTLGLAFDFYTPDRAAIEVFMLLAGGQTHATFDRLCLYPRQNRMHVDLGPVEDGRPRRLFYVDRGHGWKPIDELEAATLVA